LLVAAGLAALCVAGARRLEPLALLSVLEGRTIDARLALTPKRSPDPRLVLVVLDEASVTRPPIEMDEPLRDVVDLLFARGATAVALDLALPKEWARSGWSRLAREHEGGLTFGAVVDTDTQGEQRILGLEILDPAARPHLQEDWRRMFGLYNLEPDADGVVRRVRDGYPMAGGGAQAAFAARVAATATEGDGSRRRGCSPPGALDHRFWVDYSLDPAMLVQIPFASVREALEARPDAFVAKTVLIGAELAGMGDGHYRLPGGARAPALVVHALAINTLLEGCPVKSRAAVGYGVAALWVTLSFGVLLLARRLRVGLAVFIAGALAQCGVAALIFRGQALIMPVAAPLLASLGGLLVVMILRRLSSGPPSVEPPAVALT
jgi:CHASE2 domain-containing sensor protein